MKVFYETRWPRHYRAAGLTPPPDARSMDLTQVQAAYSSAEMIARFGRLPEAPANLVTLLEIKHQAIDACIAKIDVGARGTLVSFHNDDFPDPAGLLRGSPLEVERCETFYLPNAPRVGGFTYRGSAVKG